MQDINKTQIGAPPVLDPNKTVMGAPGMTYEATVTIKPVQCPVCKSFNPVAVMFCVECGLIFDKALPEDAFGAPAVQLPVLVDNNGREYQLRPGRTVVGRQGDILIEDTRVSRQHAAVTNEGGTILVEDVGSTNGTSVSGTKLAPGESKAIQEGETVSFGGVELRLSLPGEAAKTMVGVSNKTSVIDAAPTLVETKAWLGLPDRDVPLTLGTHTFGRREDNDIVISDAYVSGRHGEIDVTDDGVYLTDTGSSNGTLVNEAKLAVGQRTRLTPDDIVKLGQVEIVLKLKGIE